MKVYQTQTLKHISWAPPGYEYVFIIEDTKATALNPIIKTVTDCEIDSNDLLIWESR